MTGLQVFLVAFAVSYVGSIPPGSINVSVMQLSIKGHRSAAHTLAIGAVIVEFFYAGIAVKFLQLLQNVDVVYFILKMITGFGLIGLGVASFLKPTSIKSTESEFRVKKWTGFSKGFLLGLINPLSIPFWLGITTYLQDNQWISIEGSLFWLYLAGLSIGTYALLVCVDLLGYRFRQIANNSLIVNTVPGFLFATMGVYYLFMLWTTS